MTQRKNALEEKKNISHSSAELVTLLLAIHPESNKVIMQFSISEAPFQSACLFFFVLNFFFFFSKKGLHNETNQISMPSLKDNNDISHYYDIKRCKM